MCMYVYTYMCVYIHICMQITTYINTYARAYIHICTCIHRTQSFLRVECMHVYMYVQLSALYIYIYIYISVCVYRYLHVYVCVCVVHERLSVYGLTGCAPSIQVNYKKAISFQCIIKRLFHSSAL